MIKLPEKKWLLPNTYVDMGPGRVNVQYVRKEEQLNWIIEVLEKIVEELNEK